MVTGVEQERFSAVAVAPTYNNGRTLEEILRRLDTLGLPAILVNDGSTDQTAEVLESWRRRRGQAAVVLAHTRNRGKAAALRSGFVAARAAGYTHAATIDTDGQLDPEQIPLLLERARANPAALVLGVRDAEKADYPPRSRLGRRLSNGAIRVETGRNITDSQCGMRVYPLELIEAVPCHAPYFAFEAEIITRAAWAGRAVVEVPVNCRYFPPEQRVSHFRPVVDSLRGIWLHARLIAHSIGENHHGT